MRSSLEKLWTLLFIVLFIALVQLPVAAVVGVFVGQTDLAIWLMAIVAHQGVRSATDLSLRRRLGIWLAAITAGGVSVWFGAIGINQLTESTADPALTRSGQVTNLFWFVVAIRLAIRWARVAVAWAVSAALVRRWTNQRGVSLPATP